MELNRSSVFKNWIAALCKFIIRALRLYWPVIVLFAAIVVMTIILMRILGTQSGQDRKDLAAALKDIVTACSLVIGGLWALIIYYHNRPMWPKLSGVQKVDFLFVDSAHHQLRVWVEIENKGNARVILNQAIIRVYKLRPLDGITKTKDENSFELPRRDGRWIFSDSNTKQLDLPSEVNGDFSIEIEPGEFERLAFDFLIPTNWIQIEVSTHLENKLKKTEHGWKFITIHEVPQSSLVIPPN
ncbi:MAG: hypothetical protein WCG34_11630 [Leptolinea sp.]